MRNQKGFTLIEIIAVLVILGILAAVAVPRYIDLSVQAKISSAAAEVAEIKSTLNLGYYKLFMSSGVAPTTVSSIISAASLTVAAQNIGTAPDMWNVSLTAGTGVLINVINRNGDAGYAATGMWNIPQ